MSIERFIEFIQENVDWYKFGTKDMYQAKKIKAKQCEEKDFCLGKECTEEFAKNF